MLLLLLLLTNFLWQTLYPHFFREIFPQKAFPLLPRGVENARDLMRVLLRSDCFIEYTSSNRKRRRRGDDDDDTKIDFQITPEKQSTEQ